MKVLESLTKHVDHLIIGGALANTCLKALKNIGKSCMKKITSNLQRQL